MAFKTIVWPRRKILFAGLLLIIISRLASLVLPWASKYLVDDVIANKDLDLMQRLLLGVAAAIFVQSVTSFLLTRILSADQILVVEDGKIAERGAHQELIEKQGRYHQLFTYQSRI